MTQLRRAAQALRSPLARAIVAVLLLSVMAYIAHRHFDFFENGWAELRAADNSCLLFAVAGIAAAMFAQAEVMVVLLRSAGVRVKRRTANALGLAANSVSATFPGGPALSVAMIFREQLKWGATALIASWYMVLSGVLAGVGMAVLAVGSVFFLGWRVNPGTLAVSVVGLIALATATNWAARHPNQVENWVIQRLRRFNRWRRKPEDRFVDKLTGLGDQIRAVDLPLPRLALAVFWSLLNWVFEILCLLACVHAIGATPPIAGVVLSFISAKLVGQAQVTPGGLGPVDITLTTTLVGLAGLTSGQAFASVLVFRMISFVLLVAVGWGVYFVATLARPTEGADGSNPTEALKEQMED